MKRNGFLLKTSAESVALFYRIIGEQSGQASDQPMLIIVDNPALITLCFLFLLLA